MKQEILFVAGLFFLIHVICSTAGESNLFKKHFHYSLKQDDLIKRERIFERRDYRLSRKEHVVDNYLQYLRWKVLRDTAGSGKYPPSRPVEEVLEEIRSSQIYQLLRIMPKGANLHSHENHQLGKLKLLELFMSSDISNQLYVQHGENSTHEWKLEVHKEDPIKPGLFNVLQNQDNPIFSIENLAKQQTFLGALETAPAMDPTDSSKRWKLANNIFDRGSQSLVVDAKMRKNYLKAVYEQSLSEGIYYIETRKGITELDRDILLTKELLEEFKEKHPQFIGHRRIYQSKRTDASETIVMNLEEVSRVMKAYPDHVVGFDLVGEEDWGSTYLHHIDKFLEYVDDNDPSESLTSRIPWLLHTAESNWIENVHIPTVNDESDVIPRSNNLYSAILLGAKRIGHGIGFWKHPYLMELMKKRKIAVEVCVVSNQLLGYTPDLRQHPAQLFHKMGIPIILSPDDPGLFGYDEVTLDWYEAFMGWSGLNLGDLKQFGINSFQYSGMDEEEKTQAINGVLNSEWKKYINTSFTIACMENFSDDAVQFQKLFPRHGSIAHVSRIDIMGFNFETALCRKIFCRFGEANSGIVTEGFYANNQRITCNTPPIEKVKEMGAGDTLIYLTWSKETLLHQYGRYSRSSSEEQHVQTNIRTWMNTGLHFEFHSMHQEIPTTSSAISLVSTVSFAMLLLSSSSTCARVINDICTFSYSLVFCVPYCRHER